jgi:hypothetical protein
MDGQAMTSLAEPTVDSRSVEGNALMFKLAVTSALAAFADWLFCGEPLGLPVAIFAGALIGGALAANRISQDRRRIVTAGIIFVAGVIAVIEELGVVSFILLVLALATSVAIVTRPDMSGLRSRLTVLRDLLLVVVPTGSYATSWAAFTAQAS